MPALLLLACVWGALAPAASGQSPQPSSGGDARSQMYALLAGAMGLNMNATMKDCVVLLTAAAQDSPARIVLNWKPVPKNRGFAVSRRDKGGAAWAALASLPPDAVSYSDATAEVGKIYE